MLEESYSCFYMTASVPGRLCFFCFIDAIVVMQVIELVVIQIWE